jgi:hypothetical protein
VLPIEALREPHYQVLQIWSVEEKSVSVFVQNRSHAPKPFDLASVKRHADAGAGRNLHMEVPIDHVHYIINADGFHQHVTQVYFAGERHFGPVPGHQRLAIGSGAEGDLLAFLVGKYFDMRSFGKLYGIFSGPLCLALLLGRLQ